MAGMESVQQIMSKTKDDLKVEIPSSEAGMIESADQSVAAATSGQLGASSSGLSRQGSISKSTNNINVNCLCSPTTHAGSFRCRLHRAPSLQRTKSIDSQSATSKPNSATATAE